MDYVTVYDKNYAPKAFSLFESMKQHSKRGDFRLHSLILDKFEIPKELKDDHRFCYSFLEDVPELKLTELLKLTRTYGEFCWSMASIVSWHLMNQLAKWEQKKTTPLVYLDADLFFYNDPQMILDVIGDKEIAVVPHNFLKEDYERLIRNGKYNVSYVYFSGSRKSRSLLEQWAAQVITRCSASQGCGDQAYLDEWPKIMGDKLIELPIGMGTGPWHIRGYQTEFDETDGKLRLWSNDIREWKPLVLHHFHAHWRGNKDRSMMGRTGGYHLNESNIKCIYEPYEKVLEKWTQILGQ